MPGARAVRGESGGTTVTQGSQRQSGGQALGGLIDVAVQNVQALIDVTALNDVLNNAVSQNNIQVLCLNDVLNGNQTNILSDILNNSNVLSNNRDILSNNTVLQNFLNNNNIANGLQVLAVNTGNTRVGSLQPQLLSADAQQGGRVTVYLSTRAAITVGAATQTTTAPTTAATAGLATATTTVATTGLATATTASRQARR